MPSRPADFRGDEVVLFRAAKKQLFEDSYRVGGFQKRLIQRVERQHRADEQVSAGRARVTQHQQSLHEFQGEQAEIQQRRYMPDVFGKDRTQP